MTGPVIAGEEAVEGGQEPSPASEGSDTGEAPEEPVGQSAEAQPAEGAPVANALVYTGEAQPLVSAGGAWLYALDGVTYGAEIPTAVDAGEYTVYYKAAEDAEASSLTAVIDKAEVIFTPPVAATGEM